MKESTLRKRLSKFRRLKTYKQDSKPINKKYQKHQNLDNLDSSSDPSPSAPSLTSSTSQTVIAIQPRNVTIPKRPISNIFHNSSNKSFSKSSTTTRPPITGIPITPPTQSRPSPIHTPLAHIPNPESVEKITTINQKKLEQLLKQLENNLS